MKYPNAYYKIIETIKCDSVLWHFALREDNHITACKIVCFARIEYQTFEQEIITLALMIDGSVIPVDRVIGASIGISSASLIGETPDWVNRKASEMIQARQVEAYKREEARKKRAAKRAANARAAAAD